jgi:AraC-like DNA-binding protein
MRAYFLFSEGINALAQRDIEKSRMLLTEALPQLQAKGDRPNAAVAHFYLAKGLAEKGNEDGALTHLLAVDAWFNEGGYVRPDLREAYELLIDHYKDKGDERSQLRYIRTLLRLDSVLNRDYRYLTGKLHKEYDTRRLTDAKEAIERSLERRNRLDAGLVAAFTTVIGALAYRHLRARKRYLEKYKLLTARFDAPKPRKEPAMQPAPGINPDIVAHALKNLERFERGRKYLAKDMDLQRLSGFLQTNMKYASRIVYHHRGKKVTDYIRDLKVDYIVETLRTNARLRLYTDKALAEEAGFGSTQNFTKAFRTRVGMPPRFFIAQVVKDMGHAGA